MVMFIAQLNGETIKAGTQIVVALLATVCSIGTAPIPKFCCLCFLFVFFFVFVLFFLALKTNVFCYVCVCVCLCMCVLQKCGYGLYINAFNSS